MTQDEIMEMARQVGLWPAVTDTFPKEIEAFAKLVAAKERETYMQLFLDPENQPTQFGTVTLEFMDCEIAKEREACAEIAEEQRYAMYISLTSYPPQNGTAVGIANQIRAREQA